MNEGESQISRRKSLYRPIFCSDWHWHASVAVARVFADENALKFARVNNLNVGSGGGTEVEHLPRHLMVEGSILGDTERTLTFKTGHKFKAKPLESFTREVLLEGKAQYAWPPCTNQFRSAPFNIETIINLFYKQSNLNEEVNCTEPSPLVSIPWFYTCKLKHGMVRYVVFVKTRD